MQPFVSINYQGSSMFYRCSEKSSHLVSEHETFYSSQTEQVGKDSSQEQTQGFSEVITRVIGLPVCLQIFMLEQQVVRVIPNSGKWFSQRYTTFTKEKHGSKRKTRGGEA